MVNFGQGQVIDERRWASFIAIVNTKGLAGIMQYSETSSFYQIYALDGAIAHVTEIYKGTLPCETAEYSQSQNDTDKTAFESTYKAGCNQALQPRAKDGRPDVRMTTAKRTTNFKLRPITFYTADATKLHNINPVNDTDYGDVTYTMYKKVDDVWTVTTDPAEAIKTQIDFEPHYNYEIIGGYVDLPASLGGGTSDQWYLSAIGVPHYSAGAPFYGSIDFVPEVNLEAVRTGRVISDGRAISYVPYNYAGYPHTNTLRFSVKHPAGASLRFQIYIEHFV